MTIPGWSMYSMKHSCTIRSGLRAFLFCLFLPCAVTVARNLSVWVMFVGFSSLFRDFSMLALTSFPSLASLKNVDPLYTYQVTFFERYLEWLGVLITVKAIRCRTLNKKEERWPRLDFLFQKMCAFYTLSLIHI